MKTNKIVYALGFFDGVHLGHQALLRACRELAAESGCDAGAVTFQQHPQTLVNGAAPKLICSFADRDALLRRYGAQEILALPFDNALRSMPWQDFLDMLVESYAAAGFVCGYDFRFGRSGEGNASTLENYCKERNLACRVVPEQTLDGEEVSSTAIRYALQQGNFEKACAMLGHGYVLSGEVVRGRQLGSTIGIPTANLQLAEELEQPQTGVYAANAWVNGKMYFAVTNIGSRPTVGGHTVTCESFLCRWQGNAYGTTPRVSFYKYLQPVQKFDSVEQLAACIENAAAESCRLFDAARCAE